MTESYGHEPLIDKIDRKLDYVASDLSDLKVVQERIATVLELQEKSLGEHMRRTSALEERVSQFEQVVHTQRSFFKLIAWIIPVIISITAIALKVSTLL